MSEVQTMIPEVALHYLHEQIATIDTSFPTVASKIEARVWALTALALYFRRLGDEDTADTIERIFG